MATQDTGLYICHPFLYLSLYYVLLFAVVVVGVDVNALYSVVFMWSNSFQDNLGAILTVIKLQSMVCYKIAVYGLSLYWNPIVL